MYHHKPEKTKQKKQAVFLKKLANRIWSCLNALKLQHLQQEMQQTHECSTNMNLETGRKMPTATFYWRIDASQHFNAGVSLQLEVFSSSHLFGELPPCWMGANAKIWFKLFSSTLLHWSSCVNMMLMPELCKDLQLKTTAAVMFKDGWIISHWNWWKSLFWITDGDWKHFRICFGNEEQTFRSRKYSLHSQSEHVRTCLWSKQRSK